MLNWKSFINKTETYSNKRKKIIIKLYENGVRDSNGIVKKFYVNFTLNIRKKNLLLIDVLLKSKVKLKKKNV